jgi:putative MATE family efflux protein
VDRSRVSAILLLGLPIVGGMTSQTLFNLVDTAMVGRLGTDALAAVGVGGFVNFLSVALVMGLSAGVQAMASRRKGEGRDAETAVPLNGGLVLALVLALPAMAVLMAFAGDIYALVNSDPAVIALGVPYFEARLFALLGVGINFAFRGFWNGIGLSMVYLRTLIVMQLANIVLNYGLIFGAFGLPEMGTTGAGVGSAIATYIGAATYLWMAWRRARPHGFLAAMPNRETMLTMVRLSLPSSLQQVFFAGGLTALFWIVGQVGTAEVAAANVLINLTLVIILPGLALGLAAASLVGQALGAGDAVDAHRWGWDVVKVAAVVMATLGLPMAVVPELILSGFITDAETRALAIPPLRLVGIVIAFDSIGMVLQNALLGAGAVRMVMTVSIATQWGIFLPIAWLVGPQLGYGLFGIWVCQTGWRVLHSSLLVMFWQRRGWTKIKV